MKSFLPAVFILLLVSHSSNAQSLYQVVPDTTTEHAKILKGIIVKADLANDTVFKWYAESRRIYTHPDSSAVAAFRSHADKIYFIIFGGTWCDDTQFILPKFFQIQEASGFPEDRITMFGVDRKKQTTGTLASAMNIINVPTIIVMRDGKEIDRVVEYGKTGKWDQELAEIINH